MSDVLHHAQLAVVLVGLPARGKSYIAHKICRYLRWQGVAARLFNAGDYRRQLLGGHQAHDFFDPDNPEGTEIRRRCAMLALDDLVAWFRDGGEVGLYDATNSTMERRHLVWEALQRIGVPVLYVESICDDPAVIDANIVATKLHAPDYAGMDPIEAARDFRKRIAHYERAYQTIDGDAVSYVKIIDVGRQLVVNRIHGYLAGRIVSLLMNLHVEPRRILLTRHGESLYNLHGRIGGDSSLSPRGERYAVALAAKVGELVGSDPVRVMTSTLARTRRTARHLPGVAEAWRSLDEIEAGVCNGMTYEEIAARWPDEFAARRADKLRYRYRRGESYQDLIARVEPAVIELERQRADIVVVSHQAVLRCVYAYFMGRDAEEVPHLALPLHTLIQLSPQPYGCDEVRWELEPGAPNDGRVPGSNRA